MQAKGLGATQVTQVRGFADQRLRKLDNPLDPSNRRVSLIVQYIAKERDEEDAKPSAEGNDKKQDGKTSAPPADNPARKA